MGSLWGLKLRGVNRKEKALAKSILALAKSILASACDLRLRVKRVGGRSLPD
jgi:hypothetical protein